MGADLQPDQKISSQSKRVFRQKIQFTNDFMNVKPGFLRNIPKLYYDLISLFLLSGCIRLFYVIHRYWIADDSGQYLEIARNLVYHHAFALNNANGEIYYTAFRPFLYPFLIASFWTNAEPPIQSILILQIILGSSTVVIVYLMTIKHFVRFIALTSALLLALSPVTIHHTAAILTETLFTFLVVAACYFAGEQKKYFSGLFFGLACLTRPVIFPFLLLFLLLSFLPKIRPKWRVHLMICLTVFLVTLPWIARNTLLFNKVTLTRSSGYGTSLLYGSIGTRLWGDDIWSSVLKDPLTQQPPGLDEIEQDRLRMKLAVSRIVNNPAGWLKARSRQYPRLFIDSGDYVLEEQNVSFGQAVNESNFLVLFVKLFFLFFSFMTLLFFLIGIWTSGKDILNLPHIYLFPCFIMLVHLPMWIEYRYGLPSLPFIYIIGTVGLFKLFQKVKDYQLKKRCH